MEEATSSHRDLNTTAAPHCELYDGAKGYRLSDVTGSRYFRHTSGGLVFHMRSYPHSLASRFLHEYGHGTAPLT